jgi:hypothetical protein
MCGEVVGSCVLMCLIFVTLCDPSEECADATVPSTFGECCMKDLLAILHKIVSQWYNVFSSRGHCRGRLRDDGETRYSGALPPPRSGVIASTRARMRSCNAGISSSRGPGPSASPISGGARARFGGVSARGRGPPATTMLCGGLTCDEDMFKGCTARLCCSSCRARGVRCRRHKSSFDADDAFGDIGADAL